MLSAESQTLRLHSLEISLEMRPNELRNQVTRRMPALLEKIGSKTSFGVTKRTGQTYFGHKTVQTTDMNFALLKQTAVCLSRQQQAVRILLQVNGAMGTSQHIASHDTFESAMPSACSTNKIWITARLCVFQTCTCRSRLSHIEG